MATYFDGVKASVEYSVKTLLLDANILYTDVCLENNDILRITLSKEDKKFSKKASKIGHKIVGNFKVIVN